MKIKHLIFALFAICLLFVATACGKDSEKTNLNDIELKAYVIDYDGQYHNYKEALADLPEGITYSVKPDVDYETPGTYTYSLELSDGKDKRKENVELTINKLQPVYTGQKVQTIYLNDPASEELVFTFNYNSSSIKPVNDYNYREPGTYTYVLETKESSTYLAIEPVEITVNVYNSKTGFTFEDGYVVVNGQNPTGSIYLNSNGNELDSKYEIQYVGNEQSERGHHHVIANIVEKDTNKVYESFRAILEIDYEDDPIFQIYADKMFVYFFEDDIMTTNILIGNHYADYGLEHPEAKWHAYEGYTQEEWNHDVQEVKDLRTEFDTYSTDKLSRKQLNDYAIIEENIKQYEQLFDHEEYMLINLSYVDQYGGYAAELPGEVEGFHLYTKENVQDLYDVLVSVYDAFMTYKDFAVAREEKGYPLSKFTLEKFNEYLDGVIESFEGEDSEYYLIHIINDNLKLNQEKIGLTDEELAQWQDKFTKIFFDENNNKDFYDAHKDLKKLIADYIEEKSTGGYLADPNFDNRYLGKYVAGKSYYEYLIKNKMGDENLDLEAYYEQVLEWFSKYKNEWSAANRNLSLTANLITGGKTKVINYDDVSELIDFLKEFAKTIVPDLASEPDIDVAWMDPTVTENSTTSAYYMKSPLDTNGNEYIHLNGRILAKDYMDTISTMAHEGYPGHLYAYVFEKENPFVSPFATISTNTMHGEGWATYVQIELNNYIAKVKDNNDWKLATDYLNNYDLMSYLLYTLCDYQINYVGVDVKGLHEFISSVGLSLGEDDSDYEGIFNSLNENVAVYPAYGYGKAYFYQLHLDAQAKLGKHYNVVDFNEMLLSNGWVNLYRLQQQYDEYIADELFKLGLGD